MAAKVIKVLIIKNDLNSCEKQIYCVKLKLNEDLAGLKEKIYFRYPLLKDLEYQIFWLDSENDEILITCDDDFKFFVDESHVSKLIIKIIQDETTEPDEQPIRKRLHMRKSDDIQSKKIRTQLENIELSTSGSSSSDLEEIISDTDLTAISTSSSSKYEEEEVVKNVDEKAEDNDVMMEVESTSSNIMETAEQMKPKIIHVEYLPNIYHKTGTEPIEEVVITKEVSKEDNVFECQQSADSQKPSTSASTKSSSTSAQSKIVISDSSSDEEEQSNSNKKQESPNFSHTSAYAFAGNDINGQFLRTSFFDSRNHSRRSEKNTRRAENKARTAYSKAQQRSEEYQRMQQERAQEQQRRVQDYVLRAQEQASLRISNAAGLPGLLSNIQHSVEHTIRSARNTVFRAADINHHIFNNFQ